MGHFDLYGNSYKTALEAENAEMAQCAEIDSRINNQRIAKLEQQIKGISHPVIIFPSDKEMISLAVEIFDDEPSQLISMVAFRNLIIRIKELNK